MAGLPRPIFPGCVFRARPSWEPSALVPGHELLAATTAREHALLDRGGVVLPPSRASAVPGDRRLAAEGLRTIPPREQAGNVDIKQLGTGAQLLIPAPGGMFSQCRRSQNSAGVSVQVDQDHVLEHDHHQPKHGRSRGDDK